MDGSFASTTWRDVGALDDIPRLGARTVATPAGDVAVFRTAGDGVFALDDRCPHKAGKLSQGIVHGESVTCPLHGWVIGLASGEAEAPDEGCVRRVPVRLEGRRVLLQVGGVTGPVRTTCPYCGVGCGVLARPDGSVTGDPAHPSNRRAPLLQGRGARADAG